MLLKKSLLSLHPQSLMLLGALVRVDPRIEKFFPKKRENPWNRKCGFLLLDMFFHTQTGREKQATVFILDKHLQKVAKNFI
jgi:hypothetical protein